MLQCDLCCEWRIFNKENVCLLKLYMCIACTLLCTYYPQMWGIGLLAGIWSLTHTHAWTHTHRKRRRVIKLKRDSDSDSVERYSDVEDVEEEGEEEEEEEEKGEKERQIKEKARVDDLWASFKRDTATSIPKQDGDTSTASICSKARWLCTTTVCMEPG